MLAACGLLNHPLGKVVDSHPSDKNKDVARVGHPAIGKPQSKNNRRYFDSAEVRFAQMAVHFGAKDERAFRLLRLPAQVSTAGSVRRGRMRPIYWKGR
jgi:hypothetical protein